MKTFRLSFKTSSSCYNTRMENFSNVYEYATSLRFIEEYITFDRHFQIYIYLYRALLKYANFAKSCQAKGKSWVMLGQVEKAGWKDEFWSPGWKDLKVCSKVHMTKWTMYSHGQTLCSHSCLCMITRYDHIFHIHILYDHMRLCNDLIRIWSYPDNIIGGDHKYESWDPHAFMIRKHRGAVDKNITFNSVSLHVWANLRKVRM